MPDSSSNLDTRLVEFVRLGCEVRCGFLTGTIRDWATAEAVVRAIGATHQQLSTPNLLDALKELFPKLWAIQAGLDCGPVIYLRLPFLASDMIAAIGQDRDAVPYKCFSVQEHQEMIDAIEETMVDLGARVTVESSNIVYPLPEKDPHTVRARWL